MVPPFKPMAFIANALATLRCIHKKGPPAALCLRIDPAYSWSLFWYHYLRFLFMSRISFFSFLTIAAFLLGGCAQPTPKPSAQHLSQSGQGAVPDAPPPPLSVASGAVHSLPTPKQHELISLERYTVVVHEAPVKDLLFALARDAKLNIDIHPELNGTVTLNAIDQTLPSLLDRIARQVNLKWQFANGILQVEPDRPIWRQYQIDYPNLSRDTSSTVAIATQVAAQGTSGAAGGGSGSNISQTQIVNQSNHRFWQSITQGILGILGINQSAGTALTPVGSPQGSTSASASSTANSTGNGTSTTPSPPAAQPSAQQEASINGPSPVVIHPETGTLVVYATTRQHEEIQRFLDRVVQSARRQVMIEATVVEVELNDQYQQGITWDLLHTKSSTFRFRQIPNGASEQLPGGTPPSGFVPSLGTIEFVRPFGSNLLDFSIQLLQSFGKTKVLSSPKLSVLNNQTAILKVVESRVYFTLNATYQPGTAGVPGSWMITSTPNTVPIGFLMAITPQIASSGEIILNLRPTLSRLIGFVDDPAVAVNLAIARGELTNLPGVRSRIPEIQTREIESIIRVQNGDIAILGGLMREEVKEGSDTIPGIGQIPLLGELFRYRNSDTRKSELVIFLRPQVIDNPSLRGDYRTYAEELPSTQFFRNDPPTRPARFSLPER